jgi:preprotein translocase subunit SecA
MVERLQKLANEGMAAKLEGLDPEQWSYVEKQILIQVLDQHWKDHLATLDALRQVIHLRSYAQKKPIDEYKQEAFLLFERLLVSIREDVTQRLMRAQIQQEAPPPPVLPDFITQHLDPFTGDDDTADIDASTGAVLSSIPFGIIPQQPMPQREAQGMQAGGVVEAPVSRNAPCPCGSGKKYKHCHGQLA